MTTAIHKQHTGDRMIWEFVTDLYQLDKTVKKYRVFNVM